MTSLGQMLRRALVEEDAQDLVEYGLLGLFVGLAGLAVWNAIVSALGTAYTGYDSSVQGLWEPNDP
jgi:Flp pilus assembly pilin Flp